MTEKSPSIQISADLKRQFDDLPALGSLGSTEFESEAGYRAQLAHRLLMQKAGESLPSELPGQFFGSQVHYPLLAIPSTDSSAPPLPLLAPSQKLADSGFEDSVFAHPWGFRCRNRLVYANSASAHEGVNFLAANDSPGTCPNPSILQDVYVGYDGRYVIDFGLYIRCASPVPSDRRIILAVWHYTPQVTSIWQLRGSTPPMAVSNEWQRYSLQVQSGGRIHRCEVYWHDDYPQDMNFDGCYCYVQRG